MPPPSEEALLVPLFLAAVDASVVILGSVIPALVVQVFLKSPNSVTPSPAMPVSWSHHGVAV